MELELFERCMKQQEKNLEIIEQLCAAMKGGFKTPKEISDIMVIGAAETINLIEELECYQGDREDVATIAKEMLKEYLDMIDRIKMKCYETCMTIINEYIDAFPSLKDAYDDIKMEYLKALTNDGCIEQLGLDDFYVLVKLLERRLTSDDDLHLIEKQMDELDEFNLNPLSSEERGLYLEYFKGLKDLTSDHISEMAAIGQPKACVVTL